MKLKEIIEILSLLPEDKILEEGFGFPHSYRGYYDELAFEPRSNVAVKDMQILARLCIGATFRGYKGGEFQMHADTECHISYYGSSCEGNFDFLTEREFKLGDQTYFPYSAWKEAKNLLETIENNHKEIAREMKNILQRLIPDTGGLILKIIFFHNNKFENDNVFVRFESYQGADILTHEDIGN